MGPMKYDETENKRADEETKTRTSPTPQAGGSAAGGTDNKRADAGFHERKSGGPKTSGGSKIPGDVMSFSGEKV